MFGKVKQFALKKMLKSQMKGAPQEQQDMVMEILEKDPKLLEMIAKEMKDELKSNGNNQMAAASKVLPKYQSQLAAAMSPEMREKMIQMQGGAAGRFNPNGSIRR